ncbi:MAG: hypothetical protein ACTSUN_06445 [Promethearchaeota archaeon]
MIFPQDENIKMDAILNLLGDALHNFLDDIINHSRFFWRYCKWYNHSFSCIIS